MKKTKLLKGKEGLGLLVGIIVLFIFMSIFADNFLSLYNMHNLLKDTSILLIVAVGMTLVILVARIDMSVGSTMSLTAIVTTILLRDGTHIVPAIIAGILCGVLIGLLNGYLVGVQKLNHWVTTFATLSLGKGLALVICDGQIINANSDHLKAIGHNSSVFLGLHVFIWIAAAIFVFMLYVLNKTKFGYKLYSVGGSEQTATLAGMKTSTSYISVYIISGVLASIAGILLASKANNGNATIGDGYEFNAIATVLIGGTPFAGGRGGLTGTLLGAVLISTLKNGLRFIGITPSLQFVIIGVVILIVIIVDVVFNERRKLEEIRRVEQ
ncbi:MAG: ABC transporter permease [Caldicoprobacterales bacterium]|nr:ABC transporter permease [Clostridiales bacterium]